MPSRIVKLESYTFYHIYNRGWNKQKLFYSPKNYDRLLTSIEKYLDEFSGIEIHAFSLLPNHFHLLVRSVESGLEISDFMRKVQQSYAMYFNICLKAESGLKQPVFEGRFQTMAVENEKYFEQAHQYIELNPIKHKLVSDINDWPYSSFHETAYSKILTEL